jgi:hypothetical protein
MKILTNIKINIQRWLFRRRHAHESKADIEAQLKAVEKAERLSKERKCRLWVVRINPGKYRIYSKGDVKAVLRRIGLKGQIDMFTISNSVVHITK